MRDVIRQLESLQRRSRRLLVAQRVGRIAALTIVGLLVAIGLDFLLRFPAPMRLALLLAGIGGVTAGVVRYLAPAVRFRPTLTQLALRAERLLPAVRGRLASSVEFAMAGMDQENPLAARSVADVQSRLAGESMSALTDSRGALRDLGGLGAALVLVLTIALLTPQGLGTGLSRMLAPYGGAKWPARTGVASMMTDVVGDQRVFPRGRTLLLRAEVTKGPDEQRVEARYRYTSAGEVGPWRTIVLTHQSGGVHERLVDTNADAIELYFVTEDDASARERVRLAPPPAVVRATLVATPPSYASGRTPPVTLELGPGVDARSTTETPLLIGSAVDLTFQLNKTLPGPADANDAAWLTQVFGWPADVPVELTVDDGETSRWRLRWRLMQTRDLELNLVDEFGLENSEQISYRIVAAEDRPPTATITRPESDGVILPTAVVELTAGARDDVGLGRLALEARRQPASGPNQGVLEDDPAWSKNLDVDAPAATLDAELDLTPLNLQEGDIVVLEAIASDIYDLDGDRHDDVRSSPRRLRVLSELEFATRLRQDLAGVRQQAIRTEGRQAELQDDVIDRGVEPGAARAQAQIAERIAEQREALDELARRMNENRLEDEQLDRLIQQAGDLLDFAGRAANEAVTQLNERAAENADAARNADAQGQPGQPGQPQPGEEGQAGQEGQQGQQGQQPQGQQGQEGQQGQQGQEGRDGQAPGEQEPAEGAEGEDEPEDDDFGVREPTEEDRPVVDAQQKVREELSDLIKLLDRDEDTWVIQRQLESLLEEQRQLAADTADLARQTLGRSSDELTPAELTELEMIEQRQRDLAEKPRQLNEELRDRADAMDDVDPGAADRMRRAADSGEESQVDRAMEQAAQDVGQNRLGNAQQAQQEAIDALEQMQRAMQEDERARAEQLLRQLASLDESIERLIVVQENEIVALNQARDRNDFSGRDRAMIRLTQNTQAVAAEARAMGQSAARIARTLDRAADAQGAAVAALRARPIADLDAEEAEERALERLREAKTLAEEMQQQIEEQEAERRRDEILARYRELAEEEVALRQATLDLQALEQLDRRALVEARRLAAKQEEIAAALHDMRATTEEIANSSIFDFVHEMIDQRAETIVSRLREGGVDVGVTDDEQLIADSIGRLVAALEDEQRDPDDPFDQEQQEGGEQQGGQGGAPPLIPPTAELKLLRGVQEQIYNQTKDLDQRADLDAGARRDRLRDLGQRQRELLELGREMIENLSNPGPEGGR